MKIRFLPPGTKALIVVLMILALLDARTVNRLRLPKSAYLGAVAPYILLILTILAAYFVISAFFKNSRNPIIKSLKSFSQQQFWGLLFFIVSLFYLYELVFSFHNIEITGPAFYFIAYTLWYVFFIIIGILCSILFRDGTFAGRMSKANLVYWGGIANQNSIFKIVNAVAYTLFLIYSSLFLLTVGMSSTTTGIIKGIYRESGSFVIGPYRGADSFTQYVIKIEDGVNIKEFRLTAKEGRKCDWGKAHKATIKHHIFWYSAIWSNRLLECEP